MARQKYRLRIDVEKPSLLKGIFYVLSLPVILLLLAGLYITNFSFVILIAAAIFLILLLLL
jgi:hypothetical protein